MLDEANKYCARFDNSFRDFVPDEIPIFSAARGTSIETTDGRVFLDLNNGWSATSFGHGNPELLSVLAEQASSLDHTPNRLSDKKVTLCRELALASEILDAKVFLGTTGSDVVELAKKLAYRFTGKRLIASFADGFHGRTIGALSTYNPRSLEELGIPHIKDSVQFTYPYCKRCPFNCHPETCKVECLDEFERAASMGCFAAVLFEPALGSGGYVFPPMKAVEKLATVANRNRMLIVVDEIQMGLGRAGCMFLHKAFGIMPDIALLGKALSGGVFPISAAIGRPEIMDCLSPGTHTGSFAGSPIGAALGLKVLSFFEKDGFLQNINALGQEFIATMQGVFHESTFRIEIEGRGLAFGIEISDPRSGDPLAVVKENFRHELFQRGIFVLGRGSLGNRLCIIPSLFMSRDELLGRVVSDFRDALVKICV
jgi:4-aminobutyrate aminotransferase-like enzyme